MSNINTTACTNEILFCLFYLLNFLTTWTFFISTVVYFTLIILRSIYNLSAHHFARIWTPCSRKCEVLMFFWVVFYSKLTLWLLLHWQNDMTPRPSQSLKKYISIRDFTIFHICNGKKTISLMQKYNKMEISPKTSHSKISSLIKINWTEWFYR